MQNAYQGQTYNLWEEENGASFFARSAQLQCFQAVTANTLGIPVPAWLAGAIPWLQNALAGHWNGQYYQSMLPVPTDYRAPYDPNIDIVMAAIYGAVALTDTRLLATAAMLRSQWADPASTYFYPINGADQQRLVGPMLGRYPGDVYDGDTDAQVGDHPWAVSTANFAELYYRLARQVTTAGTVPLDNLSAGFFSQIEINASTTPAAAAAALRPPATGCCRRSSSTATTSSSASSSTPPAATRRASATCPGATPHSCPRSAPGTPSEERHGTSERS